MRKTERKGEKCLSKRKSKNLSAEVKKKRDYISLYTYVFESFITR